MRLIINERQLRLIAESVDNGPTAIIEYIKSFGKKGKLPAFEGRLRDCYDGAMKTAYQWACESVDGAAMDGYPCFRRNFIAEVGNSFTLNNRGLIYVERSISFDISKDTGELDFKSVGECWSWKRHNSSSYCADFSLLNNNVRNVIICGYVHPDSVDWVETIYLNSYHMKNETEIRMNDNATVEVSYIRYCGQVCRMGGSYLINASADKYRKTDW